MPKTICSIWLFLNEMIRLSIYVILYFLGVGLTSAQESEAIREFTYSVKSRGYFNEVMVDSTSVVIQTNETLGSFDIPDGLWRDLTDTMNELDLNLLKELKPPSDDRDRDAALAAKLKVKAGNKTYYSPDFDRGNPPEEIRELIEVMEKLLKSE